MARLTASFTSVATLCLVALHLVALPALYFGVGYVIRKSHEDLFVQHARTFTRVLADEFELGAALDSAARTADLLDLAIIHGEARFAEITDGDRTVRSQMGSPEIQSARHTDLVFSYGGDDVYFIVLPVMHSGHDSELRLGFDERPTQERIQLALNRMLLLLGAYACVIIAIAYFLSNRLSRPIRRLQDVSRAIASGDYAQALRVESGISELRDLAVDLEAMRRELVGVNVRLQEQITEKEIAEVRRDLLEKQLRHRQRLETVGTLAGGVAHEFNNVLVPIMLFTEMALQDLPPGSVSRSDLERVLASARRAKNVVQKILTFSRGIGDAHLTSVDLRAVIGEGLHLFSALAPPSISIRREIGKNVPNVTADATLALDLVVNLCTNALQAMKGAAGVLTVGLRYPQHAYEAADAEPLVEFWVTDTGHGMDAVTAERIFEPFFTTRPVGEGTGLGLSIVHGIVTSFGASVAIETAPGAGTTVRICFPVGRSAMPAESADVPVGG
ncbi:MAG: ATP-binding protein [Pseudomonadota bacterium]|nr:ATP-binding protein [Pseudomonadota bacterium]